MARAPACRLAGLPCCLRVCSSICPSCCFVAKSHVTWLCAFQAFVAYTYPPLACRTAAARHGCPLYDWGRPHTDSASVGAYPRSTSSQPSAVAPQLFAGASRSLWPALQRQGQRRRRRQRRPAAGAHPRRERGPGPAAGEARSALVGGPRRRPGPAMSEPTLGLTI